MSKGCHDHQNKALVSSMTVSEVKTPCVKQSETAVLVLRGNSREKLGTAKNRRYLIHNFTKEVTYKDQFKYNEGNYSFSSNIFKFGTKSGEL